MCYGGKPLEIGLKRSNRLNVAAQKLSNMMDKKERYAMLVASTLKPMASVIFGGPFS
jgi:hypothetical protein